MMKPPAILRKNMLFVGGEQGGHRAAILLSLVGSAKYCEVEPWHWLRAVLEELPKRLRTGADPPDLTGLLPDQWLKAHPEHRWKIETIRKKERQRSKQQKANKRKKR
ncbi:transposase domain-containing protein [Schlesneria sp. T3-172]|uniref:transposase domain-containing protein n=1 Tax=Schlesneria sphaerica TaxID=3373610 RepID=UPI0037C74DBA